jgi:hypothetical protein
MDKATLNVAAALLGIVSFSTVCAQGTEIPGGGASGPTAPDAAPPAAATPSPSAPSSVIYIGRDMPYRDTKTINQAILAECRLPQRGAELLEAAARSAGLNVVRNEDAAKAGKGRVLEVEIINTSSYGNAYTGIHKAVELRGRLVEDGKEIGDFAGKRDALSGGLVFRGTCTALTRCLESLASDIAQWLKSPGKNSRVGN